MKARADCGWGMQFCQYTAASTDLYLKQGQPPPDAWLPRVVQGDLLYASEEPNICQVHRISSNSLKDSRLKCFNLDASDRKWLLGVSGGVFIYTCGWPIPWQLWHGTQGIIAIAHCGYLSRKC